MKKFYTGFLALLFLGQVGGMQKEDIIEGLIFNGEKDPSNISLSLVRNGTGSLEEIDGSKTGFEGQEDTQGHIDQCLIASLFTIKPDKAEKEEFQISSGDFFEFEPNQKIEFRLNVPAGTLDQYSLKVGFEEKNLVFKLDFLDEYSHKKLVLILTNTTIKDRNTKVGDKSLSPRKKK